MLQSCKELAERAGDHRAPAQGVCKEWEGWEEPSAEERKTPIFPQSEGPGKEGDGWMDGERRHLSTAVRKWGIL